MSRAIYNNDDIIIRQIHVGVYYDFEIIVVPTITLPNVPFPTIRRYS